MPFQLVVYAILNAVLPHDREVWLNAISLLATNKREGKKEEIKEWIVQVIEEGIKEEIVQVIEEKL